MSRDDDLRRLGRWKPGEDKRRPETHAEPDPDELEPELEPRARRKMKPKRPRATHHLPENRPVYGERTRKPRKAPKPRKREERTSVLSVLLTAREHEAVRMKAATEGRSMSSWARLTLISVAGIRDPDEGER